MANLISWDDPLKKRRNQSQNSGGSNPFEQFGNWISRGGFVGDIARNVFGQNQNQNRTQTPVRTTTNLNTANQNKNINKFNTNFGTLNNNFRSTNTLNRLNTLNSSQPKQTSMSFLTSQKNSVGGEQDKQPKLNTISNGNNTLTTLKSGLGPTSNLQNFEQRINTQRQQQQSQEEARKQALNNRAEQARSFYDSNLQSLADKANSSRNITGDSYKDIAGQSVTNIANSYKNNALRKLANDDMTLSNKSSDLVDKYRSLSSDDKWDVYQNLQKAKNKLTQAITKADDEGRNDLKEAYASQLSEVNLFDEMLANEDKGEKSFGKSLADYLSGGAFVGNLAEPVTNALGNISGNHETSRAISQDRAATKEGNNKLFDAVDFVGETTANIAANALTGGAYGLASSGMNLGDAIQSAVNDRNRQYYTDYEGNLTREDQSIGSKLAGVGNAALGLGMTAAGMKGFGPNIKFEPGKILKNVKYTPGQTLQNAIATRNWGDLGKAMGIYAAKEVPFAGLQTVAQQGISAAGGDQKFGENFGQQLASNIVSDLAIDTTGALRQGRGGSRDLFEPSRQSEQSALQRLADAGEKVPAGLSIKFDPKIGPYVKEDTNQHIFDGKPENAYPMIAKRYLNDNFKNQALPLNQGGEMIVGNRGIGKFSFADSENQPSKLRLAPEMENVAKVARLVGERGDTGSRHGNFAKNGWEYRNFIFEDPDGERFRGTLNVARGDGNKQFYDVKPITPLSSRNQDQKTEASNVGMKGSAPSGSSSADQSFPLRSTVDDDTALNANNSSIARNNKNVNGNTKRITELQNQLKSMGSRANSLFDPEVRAIKDELQALRNGYNSVEEMNSQQAKDRTNLQEEAQAEREARRRLATEQNNQLNGDESYMMRHRPDTDGATVDKLDIFDGERNFDKSNAKQSKAYKIIQEARNNPDAEITIYRATTGDGINEGDWVGLTKEYAQEHLEHSLSDNPNAKIVEKTVKAKDIRWGGDSIDEYGYFPAKASAKPDTRSVLERMADFGNKHGAGLSIKLVNNQQEGKLSGTPALDKLKGADNRPQNNDGKSALTTALGLKNKINNGSNQQRINNENFDTDAYVKQQVAMQQKQSKTPLKERTQASIDNLKHYIVDDAVAYQRYVKDKGERQIIDNGVDRVRASDTIAKQMIEDSGLAETIGKMSQNDADEFQQYLIAKRGRELKRQKGADFKTGRDDVADQQLIKAVGDKYAEQEKVVRDFNKMMLDYSVETGLISKGLRDQLVRDNTDYVPMNRIMDDIEGMGMHKSKQLANLSKQTAVQKIKGSDRVVQNPLESMIKNAVRVVNEGERNKTAKYLADTAAFREARMPEGAKARPGYDTLSFLQDGKQVKYEVPELVAKEMKNLNSVMGDNAQKIVNVLSTPARLLRAGATGDNPMFAASNLIRDQLQTVVTGNLKANIKGTPKAIVAAFAPGQKGRALRAELARAGVTGTEYRQTYGYKPGELVKELQAGHQMPKQAWERLKHPIDTIADVIGRTEYFTRAQQYFGTDGTPEQKALAARNNTLNFGRGGSAVRVLNKMIPFLNAGVQGGRITVRQFKERPIRTTGAIAATIGVAAAARAINSSINQDLYDRLGDEEKKNNLVFFTEDAKYDPETNRVTGVVKVPMPQMLYPVLDAVNNIEGKPEDLLTMAGDIFTAISGIEAPDTQANNIGESFLPVVNQLTPTAIKPFLETAMNKNTYTGQEIVSEYDANKNPEDKGAKYTTDAARKLAKITGVDAPVIDNFINNWGGGVAKDLVKVLGDNPDNKKDGGGIGRIFDEGAFRRFASGSVESQYEIAEGIAKNYKNEVKNSDAFKNLSAADKESVLNAIDTDMNKIASISAKVEQNRGDEIGKNGLSKRQTEIMNNGFNSENYINAILDDKQLYHGNNSGESGGDFKTLNGNPLEYGKANTARNSQINVNNSLSDEHKNTLNTYSSMSSDDWEKYTYQPANRDAEYKLALAKFENDDKNGELTDVDRVKRQKELRKLEVSQQWDKSTRDAYGLASNRTDMQDFLNSIDNRDDMVGYLNALNRAMYDAGVITASTYKTRNRNINNISSSSSSSSGGKKSGSSGLSSAAKSALSAYTKALTSGSGIKVNSTPKAPSTSRKMANTSLKSTNLKKYTPGNPTITVKKGIK